MAPDLVELLADLVRGLVLVGTVAALLVCAVVSKREEVDHD